MRLTSACWLLWLCTNFCFVNAGSSSHSEYGGTGCSCSRENQIRQENEGLRVRRRDTGSEEFAGFTTRMVVSPTWYLSVGDTVEINCTAHNDKGNYSDKLDLQLVWTKIGPGDRTKKVLVSQRASTGIFYVLGPVTHEHQGVYTCDDDGSLPDVYVHDWHHIIWVADATPKASIDVISHNRNQFLTGEIFSLSCQLPDDNTQWKMMRFDKWLGNVTECPGQVSSGRSLSCTIRSDFPWADRLYWCESPTGMRSNALNITTTVSRTVVLESPPLPVLEGEDVTLHCLKRNKTTKEFTSDFRALYFKNDHWVRYRILKNLTLTAVTKADEGLYKCKHLGEGSSAESWITVKARPNEDQKKKNDIKTS